MIVQIPWQMSGGRHDDRPWPPPYTEFEVPDWEGRDLIAGGNAMFVRDSAVAKPAAAPVPVPDLAPAPAPAAEKPAEKPAVKAEEKPASKPAEKPAVKPAPEAEKPAAKAATAPAPSEPKAAWVEFAVSRGANEAKANEMSKADLMSRYGGRL